MQGDYFVALDKRIEKDEVAYWRTVHNRFVYEKDLLVKALPPVVGERIEDAGDLPPAVVHQDDTPVYRLESSNSTVVGRAEKHARIHVTKELEKEGQAYVAGGDLILQRDHVRYRLSHGRSKINRGYVSTQRQQPFDSNRRRRKYHRRGVVHGDADRGVVYDERIIATAARFSFEKCRLSSGRDVDILFVRAQ